MRQPEQRPSAVIVGAGPAGAALAVALARAGIPTTLVEAAADFSRQFRGEALMPSGLAALRQLQLWPLPAAVPQRQLQGWRLVVEGRQLFELAEPLGGHGASCTLVSQRDWLAALLDPEQRPPELSLRLGTAVQDLQRDAEGRVGGVRLANGTVIPADLVVACDGRASLIRKRAGLSLQGSERPIDVLWFHFGTDASPYPDGCFSTMLSGQGIYSLFVSARGSVQLGWALPPDAPTPQLESGQWIDRWARAAPAELAAWLQRNGDQLKAPVRLSVQVGMVKRWWQPGLLLLGDAAHPMSPVRAQGINMALRDAAVAARELVPLLDSRRPLTRQAWQQQLDARLAAIAAARRPEVEQLQRLQAEELQRGSRLQGLAAVRQLLALNASWLGPAIGRHWRHQQQPLRHGLSALATQPGRP